MVTNDFEWVEKRADWKEAKGVDWMEKSVSQLNKIRAEKHDSSSKCSTTISSQRHYRSRSRSPGSTWKKKH